MRQTAQRMAPAERCLLLGGATTLQRVEGLATSAPDVHLAVEWPSSRTHALTEQDWTAGLFKMAEDAQVAHVGRFLRTTAQDRRGM